MCCYYSISGERSDDAITGANASGIIQPKDIHNKFHSRPCRAFSRANGPTSSGPGESPKGQSHLSGKGFTHCWLPYTIHSGIDPGAEGGSRGASADM